MSANSFGQMFRVTSFGESHGASVGALIEGCPAGVIFHQQIIDSLMARRRPGQHLISVSDRQETDQVEVHSGVFEGKTLGTPILAMVRNQDARSSDYSEIQSQPRIGHADDTWRDKFGHVDHRGGGRSSGRETLARVIGGAFAQMFIAHSAPSFRVFAYPRRIGSLDILDSDLDMGNNTLHLKEEIFKKVESLLSSLKLAGDSVGGIVEIRVLNCPKGLGQPVFRKLKSDLASAYMSIGATCSLEMGDGVAMTEKRGVDLHTKMESPSYGGIRGGISTGETITIRVGFKPTSSILNIAKKGRHDPCILIRALPVLEAMSYLVFADHQLWSRLDRI